MSGAEYRVTHRLGENGVPLLVLTLRMEHEVTLAYDQIQDLDHVVNKRREGEDVIDKSDAEVWLEEIRRLASLFNEVDGVPHWALFEMQSDWRALPFRHAEKILDDFSALVRNGITCYVSGSYPVYEVSINWGSRTIRFPLSRSEISTAIGELQALQTAAKAVDDAKTDEAKDAAKAIYDGAAATSAVVGAARIIGTAAAGGLTGGPFGAAIGVIVGVAGAAIAIKGLIDSEDKRREEQREAEEKAMRTERQRQTHDAGIEYGKGLELGDRFRRTG